MIRTLTLIAAISIAAAQQPAAGEKATITGIVKDSVAGKPLAEYTVSTYINANFVGDAINMTAETRQVTATTDAQGRYKLSDLPPGDYRITAAPPRSFTGRQVRHITVAGRDLEHIDFSVPVAGTITGRIVDENREPMPNMSVWLVSREYYSGVLGYFLKGYAMTDDRGDYTLERVEAEHPYLVMTGSTIRRLSPRSDAPLDPKLRRRVPMWTFYPNSPDREGASPILLRPGEKREGVNIEVRKGLSLCVEGTVSGLAGPAALHVQYEPAQPSYGTSSTGGMFGVGPSTTTAADGKFRFCGLTPGPYRLGAADGFQGVVNRAMLPIELRDRDLANVSLTVGPGLPLQGEVVWDGDAPATPPNARVNVTLNPLLRSPIANERAGERSEIPGAFSISGLLPSDYSARASIANSSLYVKEFQYAGQSILYAPLRFGSALGNTGLRVIVARDGGRISALVRDKDGNPLGDLRIIAFPAEIASEAALQAALITGQTSQTGRYRSQALRPGKYFVAATEERVNATPESIGALWRARTRFKEVELSPTGSAEVALTPISLK